MNTTTHEAAPRVNVPYLRDLLCAHGCLCEEVGQADEESEEVLCPVDVGRHELLALGGSGPETLVLLTLLAVQQDQGQRLVEVQPAGAKHHRPVQSSTPEWFSARRYR